MYSLDPVKCCMWFYGLCFCNVFFAFTCIVVKFNLPGTGLSEYPHNYECVVVLLTLVITTEKTNILLRYLHQQLDKKVCRGVNI